MAEHGTIAGYMAFHTKRAGAMRMPHSDCQGACLRAWTNYYRRRKEQGK